MPARRGRGLLIYLFSLRSKALARFLISSYLQCYGHEHRDWGGHRMSRGMGMMGRYGHQEHQARAIKWDVSVEGKRRTVLHLKLPRLISSCSNSSILVQQASCRCWFSFSA